MPQIFDNINQRLLPQLLETVRHSRRADFCVGYFNLRGWRLLSPPDEGIDSWSGRDDNCCRLLVGMTPQSNKAELLRAIDPNREEEDVDNSKVVRLKHKLASDFRDQLMVGSPTNADEAGLRRLRKQLEDGKVRVKLYLRHQLHAKLYMLHREDPINPSVGYIGSSNLTMSGLSGQGELNIDVMDGDACDKLSRWFEDRWNDRWCVDISDDLIKVIADSWAGEPVTPYEIYIKMAWEMSRDAREGLTEFHIPQDMRDTLLPFQEAAVKIAANHVNKRDGVIIGDVVGLGKTMVATAVARIFQDDRSWRTLIFCPPNLIDMWGGYVGKYNLHAEVMSVGMADARLENKHRFPLVLIDESHNFRNRAGKRYQAIQNYVKENMSKCVLLSATPYNKNYTDLSGQLRLFVPEDANLGIRPEAYLKSLEKGDLMHTHQVYPNTIQAFEQSEHADDWRSLMRLFLVRRTRSFIQRHYAEMDPERQQYFLKFNDGRKSYFPRRLPRTVKFEIDDQYALLFDEGTVKAINGLSLPRYGLANYVDKEINTIPMQAETQLLSDLSKAGNRLKGFTRIGLLKRLESSGWTFLLSLQRHILRNYIFLHAIENRLELPIGTIDPMSLDEQFSDNERQDENQEVEDEPEPDFVGDPDEKMFRELAARKYEEYRKRHKERFRWIRSALFNSNLATDLKADAESLQEIWKRSSSWNPTEDEKLNELHKLIAEHHPQQKVLVFSQYADTVRYLASNLKERGLQEMEMVIGSTSNPTEIAKRFSPISNLADIAADEALRVLIATDVLSEGQNLQDCSLVVNYDLPWAIIRLIQRAGRVDRIGQEAEEILCFSFLPAEGIEREIDLRKRVMKRLKQNAELVGTDEAFFEDEDKHTVRDIYNEKAGILDDDEGDDIDLSSYAYQIWKDATKEDQKLERRIEDMPNVVYSAKAHDAKPERPPGSLVYVKTAEDNDMLAWINAAGESVTESQYDILRAAACDPDTPGLERSADHHQLVGNAVERLAREDLSIGGQLGRSSGIRARVYRKLTAYEESEKDTLFNYEGLPAAIQDIYNNPLQERAKTRLARQLRLRIPDNELAQLVADLHRDGVLCVSPAEKTEPFGPRIICSLGLIADNKS